MSTLLYGLQRTPVPSGDNEVRTTITIVNQDDPPATQEHVTDWNETFTDPDTAGGLTSRQESSHVNAGVHSINQLGLDAEAGHDEHNAIVDRQVATSGVAAAKEARGEWGHGTMKIVSGIEPTVRDGSQLGADYFVANPRQQAHSASFMTPAQAADVGSVAKDSATGKDNARAAYDGSMYAAFYAARMAGQ
jgi:hypothetical protein